jgi:hypothetical protein
MTQSTFYHLILGSKLFGKGKIKTNLITQCSILNFVYFNNNNNCNLLSFIINVSSTENRHKYLCNTNDVKKGHGIGIFINLSLLLLLLR